MATIDELREKTITKIQAVFRKDQQPKKIARRGGERLLKKEIADYFADQTWDKLIDDDWIIFRMSDADYVWEMTDEAYLYYLPAFLIAALNQPEQWSDKGWPLSQIIRLLPKFSAPQLEALIAFLEYFIEPERESYEQRQRSTRRVIHNHTLEKLEDVRLRATIRLKKLDGN